MVKGKRILITGGNGFVGSALAEKLSDNNEIIVMDTDSNVRGDITSYDMVSCGVAGVDIVIHTAAKLGVQNVVDDAIGTLETNYIGTSNVLKAAYKNKVSRVIVFSSSEIYGENAHCIKEEGHANYTNVSNPRWCYAASKLAAEQLAMGYYRQSGLPVVVIRPFNVFGPGRRGSHAVLTFIQKALSGEDITVFGEGTQMRAWCHIYDFCNGVLRCIEDEHAIGHAFNIGNPVNTTSIIGLARTIKDLCKSKSHIIFSPEPYKGIGVRVPSIEKARSILGYNPKILLEEGLDSTIEWVGKNCG